MPPVPEGDTRDAFTAERTETDAGTISFSVTTSSASRADTPADAGFGILDAACRYSVAGQHWYDNYRETLRQLGLDAFCTKEAEKDT